MGSGSLLEQFSRVYFSFLIFFFHLLLSYVTFFLLLLDDKARAGMHRD